MRLPTEPDDLVDEKFVAAYYKQAPRTIKLWRYQGRGPRYMRLSVTQVRYRWGDILEHNSNLSATSTSEESVRSGEVTQR